MPLGLHNLKRALGTLVVLSSMGMAPGPSWAVPSFARQTGMTCAACHTVFPELTPFGREFKLNGYVLDNIRQITGIDVNNKQTLTAPVMHGVIKDLNRDQMQAVVASLESI